MRLMSLPLTHSTLSPTHAIGALAALLVLGSGCAHEEAPGTPVDFGHAGTGVEVVMGPLDLAGASDVCYSFAVVNGLGDLVVGLGASHAEPARHPGGVLSYDLPAGYGDPLPGGVCSTRFGDGPGGSWSYVAPCDASPGAVHHDVMIWLDRLEVDGADDPLVPGADYQDPCPQGCVAKAQCVANADVAVRFDLTVMRRAEQGFFDVAVNFGDIFCSAKVDCERAPGEPLHLLHHPETGERGPSAVLAVACAGGGGTALHMDPVDITCADGARILLDPTAGPGNAWPAGAVSEGSPVWQYGVYRGGEALDCAGGVCEQVYWNVVVGYDPDAPGCRLRASATASLSDAMLDGLTPEDATYPILAVDVPLTGEAGGRVCAEHPLHGADGGVVATYAPIGERRRFCHRFDGDQASTPNGGAHGCAYPTAPTTLTAPPGGVTCVGMSCEDPATEESWLPEATFWQGCNEDRDANCNLERELAQRPVNLSPYFIDKYPVTAARYEACVLAGVCSIPPVGVADRYTYGDPDKQDHPITHTNFERASTYCAWDGKPAGAQRLCTEAEWEHAARGGCDTVTGDCAANMRPYPWDAGDDSPSIPATCERANIRLASGVYCEPGSQGNTAPVTSRPLGASPYGVMDMSGQMWEWTGDWFLSGYPDGLVTDPQGPDSSPQGGRIVRGGSFRDYPGRPTHRGWSLPGHGFDNLGFRCCRTPPQVE